jgi:ribonuclease J
MESLRIAPLGGLGEFGLNMMVLEYGESAIAIDCGLMFPGQDLLGVDLVIPDVSYLVQSGKRLHGIVLTHAHEDHIGALPYLAKLLRAPVFGTRLTLGLLRHKLQGRDFEGPCDLREIAAGRRLELGPFVIEGIRVTHSLLDCLAIAVETPLGVVIHTGDFKIDLTPMEGELFDFQRFAAYGERGVLLLLSDSTNVERPGCTPSEREMGRAFEEIFRNSRGRLFVATFSSNIPRIQQVIELSRGYGRQVVLSGRSMIGNTRVAAELGYLSLGSDVMTEFDRWQALPKEQLAFLTTGSQGEPLSVLYRIALDEHKSIRIEPGDTVVLSARFIPGNERVISHLIDHLYRRGAEVHYERVSEVHVSGHASQEELKTMIQLTRPRYFVPIHGEYRNLFLHLKLAQAVGVPPENCFLLEDGQVLELTGDAARRRDPVPAGRVFVDGRGVGDVEDVVIRDRRHLAEDGLVVAVMAIHRQSGELIAGPDLVSRGFIRSEEGEEILEGARRVVVETISGANREARAEVVEMQEEVRKALRRYFRDALERRPVVIPFILEM